MIELFIFAGIVIVIGYLFDRVYNENEMRPKFDFDVFLTWHKGDYNYINLLPRLTLFVSPIFKDSESGEMVGKCYSLQVGWLVFECAVDMELKEGTDETLEGNG